MYNEPYAPVDPGDKPVLFEAGSTLFDSNEFVPRAFLAPGTPFDDFRKTRVFCRRSVQRWMSSSLR